MSVRCHGPLITFPHARLASYSLSFKLYFLAVEFSSHTPELFESCNLRFFVFRTPVRWVLDELRPQSPGPEHHRRHPIQCPRCSPSRSIVGLLQATLEAQTSDQHVHRGRKWSASRCHQGRHRFNSEHYCRDRVALEARRHGRQLQKRRLAGHVAYAVL